MPWEITIGNLGILSVHAALLPNGPKGQVLLMGGDEHWQAQAGNDVTPANPANVDRSRVYDVQTKTTQTIGSPTTDIFCSGHAFLGDGRLFIGGGTKSWVGGDDPGPGDDDHGHDHGLGNFGGDVACWVYNYKQRVWVRVRDFVFRSTNGADMPRERQGGGRWYPSIVTLPNGDLIAFGGHPDRNSVGWHSNNIPERYIAATDTWVRLQPVGAPGASGVFDYYPRIHLIKGGKVFICRTGSNSFLYDPSDGSVDETLAGPVGAQYGSWNYASIQLPLLPGENHKPIILVANDVQPQKIDLNFTTGTPSWVNTAARTGSAAGKIRKFGCACYLPDGRIFFHGGIDSAGANTSDSLGVLTPEIFDPGINWTTKQFTGTESWTTVEDPANAVRNYHSVMLLLPDGSIYSGGSSKGAASGNPATEAEMRVEVYKPDYFSNPGRPRITASPKSLSYTHNRFRVTIENAVASDIRQVALVRAGSVTHAGDFDQRYVALDFSREGSSLLEVRYPTDSSVLPPGYYMLWIVTNSGLPCEVAPFVRISHQDCFIYTDRSTFSSYEIEAMNPSVASPAVIPRSFYCVFDGFLRDEIGAPTISFHQNSDSGPAVSQMTFELRNTELEDPSAPDEKPQRHTYTFDIKFTGLAAFDAFTESQTIWVRAEFGNHVCSAPMQLIKQPNPYMRDGATHWLSTDVRVFQIEERQSRASIPHGTNPNTFVQNLITRFDTLPNDEFHPFFEISTDQATSKLELSGMVNGRRVYNYAIAKVRYRALAINAPNVKVFFRMFNTAGTAMQYDPNNTHRRANVADAAIPLLGYHAGQLSSIPFFAEPRVDYTTQLMSAQTDNPNRKTLLAQSDGDEYVGYFGCWLDMNQTTPLFPVVVSGDGPFLTPVESIQQKVRGAHQCLVAEVFFEPDPMNPTPANESSPLIPYLATPGSSDKLSQRNLAIEESDNPGGPETHTVQTTIEIKASTAINLQQHAAVLYSNKVHARNLDELVFHWNDLPRDSRVELYLPEVHWDEIQGLIPYTRLSQSRIERVDDHTFSFLSGDISYIPLPIREGNIVGLLTIYLPNNVVKGQEFNVVIQQYDATRRIVGSFQFKIPVRVASEILGSESRKLSVMRYIEQGIPWNDRWRPIFDRYLTAAEGKVRGLGGNPDSIAPSPNGDGKVYERPCDPKLLCTMSFLFAVIPVLMATLSYRISAPIVAGISVMLVCIAGLIAKRCRLQLCHVLRAGIVGAGIAGLVLGILILSVKSLNFGTPLMVFCFVMCAVFYFWLERLSCNCGDKRANKTC